MTRTDRVRAWVRRNVVASTAVAAAFTLAAAYLAFGFFGIQTLFVDDVVDEAAPFSAGPGASGLRGDAIDASTADAMNEAMEDDGVPDRDGVDDDMPGSMETEPSVLVSGSFIDRSHPTSGSARVLTDGTRRVLRFEDFETDNGPDLNVYLVAAAADTAADDLTADFVDLGDLKGNIGNQNYEIPDDVDLDRYPTVVIWCVRFGVAFGAADLV